jgi:tetratricopeptide (TPR) repeat protein
VADELERSDRRLAPKLEARLSDAIRAYERDRYQDARRILRPLAESTPDAPAVRELYGLTLYRMSRWADALKELQAFHGLSGSYDQYPVMADCFRALRRWKAVEQTWDQLREASPSAEVVTEGRIVMAGALADRGRLAEAIRLLERQGPEVKRPRLHHLRTWYALADLYERAGELPRARALFTTVLRHDHDFADVAERLAALG